MPYAGELSALLASVLWSAASIPFTAVSKRAGAVAVNAFKTTLGSAVLLVVVCAWSGPGSLFQGDLHTYFYLALSGWIGLSVADCLLFHSYTLIGPRLTFLIFSTSPFLTALLAWPLLDETLGWKAFAGMAVTLGGILLVTLETSPEADRLGQGCYVRGLIFAGLAAAGMALASVLLKIAMQPGTLEVLPGHAFRMTAGALGLLAGGALTGSLRKWAGHFRPPRMFTTTGLGTLFGPVFGVWFFILGITLTREAGVAMTLSSLSPVVVIPLTWIFHNDRPSLRAILGAGIAVAGVGLIFLRA